MRRALRAVLMVAATACGSSSSTQPDGGVPGPDATPTAATFHDFVEDLVRNHTTATEAPRPIDFMQADDGRGFDDLF